MTNKQIYGILAISLLIIIPLYWRGGSSGTSTDQTASVQAPCIGQSVMASLDPSNPPAGGIAPGQTNAFVMSIKLQSTVCAARLESLTLALAPGNTVTASDIGSVSLFSGNINISNMLPLNSTMVFNMINAPYSTIPQNGSSTYDIKVTVKSGATFGHVLKFMIVNSNSLSVVSSVTGAVLPVGGTFPLNSNNQTIMLGTSQPDLVVTSLLWRQTPNYVFGTLPISQSISPNATLIQYKIKNNGSNAVTLPGNSVIKLYKSVPGGQQTLVYYPISVPQTIAPGATLTLVNGMGNAPLLFSQLGTFQLKIDVDPLNAVGETNEGNNTLMPMPSVTIVP